jgi:signal transduction histidine kinase
VQEALTNVVKHAEAKNVSVVVTRRAGGVGAVVEDDGRGFAEAGVRDDALGIVGMRERVALLGGTLTFESSPGGGTSLVAYIPSGAAAAESSA